MSQIKTSEKWFGDRLRYVMDQRKISPTNLANDLQIDKAQISRWINNNVAPRDSTITKLREFFDCNFVWLKYGEGYPYPPEFMRTEPNIGGNQRWKDSTQDTSVSNFQDQKKTREMENILSEIKREKFKLHCGTFFEDLFDFIADSYGEDKEGAEAFLDELQRIHPKFKHWDEEKKRAKRDRMVTSGEDVSGVDER